MKETPVIKIGLTLFLTPFLAVMVLLGRGDSLFALEADRIAMGVDKVLSAENYARQSRKEFLSTRFLGNYLDALDHQRLFFQKPDIDEFEQRFGASLENETSHGNIQPLFEIHRRLIQRMKESAALAGELLRQPLLPAVGESVLKRDQEADWPSNESEARQLWRQQILLDLLCEEINGKKPSEAVPVILDRYKRRLRNACETDTENKLRLYLNALTHAYDPHSEYLTPSEVEQSDTVEENVLQSIGVTLEMENGYARVGATLPGDSAYLDHPLQVGDRIMAVAKEEEPFRDVADLKLDQVTRLFRGSRNRIIRLLTLPFDALDPMVRMEITLRGGEIKSTQPQAKAERIEWTDENGKKILLGRIALPMFYTNLDDHSNSSQGAGSDVSQLVAILKTEKIEGLLLDLRGNQGGELSQAVKMAGLFIPWGPIVQLKDAQGRIQIMNGHDQAVLYEGPLVVLVDRLSASATEIFAAALQDYGRAVIVGNQNTFGKGTLQELMDLSSHPLFAGDNIQEAGALKLTIQQFYRPAGGALQGRGVTPDIVLPSLQDALITTENSLKSALSYDEISPAPFTAVNQVVPYLKKLRTASEQRMAGNPGFGLIREEINRLKISRETKTLSLDKERRLKEIQTYFGWRESLQESQFLQKPLSLKATEISPQANGEIVRGPPLPENNDPLDRPIFEESIRILTDLIHLTP